MVSLLLQDMPTLHIKCILVSTFNNYLTMVLLQTLQRVNAGFFCPSDISVDLWSLKEAKLVFQH